MKTYGSIAATALREFAESNGVYVATATAEAGIGAILDALGEHGADMGVVHEFLNEEVVEPQPDPWATRPLTDPVDNAALLRRASEILAQVAESL